MGLRKKTPRPSTGFTRKATGAGRGIIFKGTRIHLDRIKASVPKGSRGATLLRWKKIARISGYELADFLAAFSNPPVVGSKGFLAYEVTAQRGKKRKERLFLIKGVVVPRHQRRKGNRVELHRELLRRIYRRYGALINAGEPFFFQTQIAASDMSSFRTLSIRLGYIDIGRVKSSNGTTIVLRRKLDGIEMKKLLNKKELQKALGK